MWYGLALNQALLSCPPFSFLGSQGPLRDVQTLKSQSHCMSLSEWVYLDQYIYISSSIRFLQIS